MGWLRKPLAVGAVACMAMCVCMLAMHRDGVAQTEELLQWPETHKEGQFARVEARAIEWFEQRHPQKAAKMGDARVIENAIRATENVMARHNVQHPRQPHQVRHHAAGFGVHHPYAVSNGLTQQQQHVIRTHANALANDFYSSHDQSSRVVHENSRVRGAAGSSRARATAAEAAAEERLLRDEAEERRAREAERRAEAEGRAREAAALKREEHLRRHEGARKQHSTRQQHQLHQRYHHLQHQQHQQHATSSSLAEAGKGRGLVRRAGRGEGWGAGKGPMDEAFDDLSTLVFGAPSAHPRAAHRPSLPGVNAGWGMQRSAAIKEAQEAAWRKTEHSLLEPHSTDPRELWTGVSMAQDGPARLQSLALPSSVSPGFGGGLMADHRTPLRSVSPAAPPLADYSRPDKARRSRAEDVLAGEGASAVVLAAMHRQVAPYGVREAARRLGLHPDTRALEDVRPQSLAAHQEEQEQEEKAEEEEKERKAKAAEDEQHAKKEDPEEKVEEELEKKGAEEETEEEKEGREAAEKDEEEAAEEATKEELEDGHDDTASGYIKITHLDLPKFWKFNGEDPKAEKLKVNNARLFPYYDQGKGNLPGVNVDSLGPLASDAGTRGLRSNDFVPDGRRESARQHHPIPSDQDASEKMEVTKDEDAFAEPEKEEEPQAEEEEGAEEEDKDKEDEAPKEEAEQEQE